MKIECKSNSVTFKGKAFPCTVSLTMNLLGGKWKALIIYHLIDGTKRYNELRKAMPSITEMTLSLQLRQLEKAGLVTRKIHGRKPPLKVAYSLTDFGVTAIPLLTAITEWGNGVVVRYAAFENPEANLSRLE